MSVIKRVYCTFHAHQMSYLPISMATGMRAWPNWPGATSLCAWSTCPCFARDSVLSASKGSG